jgi:HD-GYP domain-containing protein (c-di-GMP phosphodiesterase class II)
VEEAIEELRCCSNTQFDPVVVEKLISLIRKCDKLPQPQGKA